MENIANDSKCLQRGQEIYKRFKAGNMFSKEVMWCYYYRHIDGELFFCVASTLEECRQLKEEWVKELKD